MIQNQYSLVKLAVCARVFKTETKCRWFQLWNQRFFLYALLKSPGNFMP
jgi:hypothetical protein